MKNNDLLEVKKIINRIKILFCNKEKNNFESAALNKTEKIQTLKNNLQDKFQESLKVNIDFEIFALKIKLENNEIKVTDLTEEQMDKLQKIYDKEIIEKRNKIKRLKGTS